MPVPIVLAIEPDRRQAAHVSAVVKHRVGAELILADTTEGALDAIGSRVPDLVLVPALLSPQDDAALAAALRVIAAAAHVRTLTIPVFASSGASSDGGGGLLARFRRGRSEPSSSVGCDPAVFAEQITEYLREAAAERAERETDFQAFDVAPRPAADETPVIESSFIESPAIEPPAIEPPAVETIDVPIEPVRFIAPAVVNRPAPAAAPPPPALDFVEAATAEFGDHAFVEPRAAAERPLDNARSQDTSEAATAAYHPPHHELVTDLSSDVADIAPERREPEAGETFDGEPFGVYTLSLDQPLESPAEAAGALAATDALDAEADILREFVVEEPPPAKPIDESAWLALGLRYMRQWPAMEGTFVEHGPLLADLAAAVAPKPRMSAKSESVKQAPAKPAPAKEAPVQQAPPAAPPATPAAAHRPDPLDWAELVASLRQDIERRRKQPPAPATAPPPAPSPAAAAAPAPAPIAPVKQMAPITPIAQAAPRPVDLPPRAQLHAIDGAARRGRKPSPVQDEWGFFDPQQCGFAALLAKLDEYSNADEPEVRKTS
jgi:hypothetical protein